MKGRTKLYESAKVTEDLESVVNHNAIWASQRIDQLRKESNRKTLGLYLLTVLVGLLGYKLHQLDADLDKLGEKHNKFVNDFSDRLAGVSQADSFFDDDLS